MNLTERQLALLKMVDNVGAALASDTDQVTQRLESAGLIRLFTSHRTGLLYASLTEKGKRLIQEENNACKQD